MFVDVHSHVVPSGDDGASSLAEGLELCREAGRRGTSVLFATPHVSPNLPLTAGREEQIRRAYAQMVPQAAEHGLDLRLGFELTPAPELLEEDLTRYLLGDLAAVLVELPFAGPIDLAERVAEEIEGAGLMPVIAHPERAERVIERPERVEAFVDRGWILQVNATSLLGEHGPGAEATGWLFVERGLAGLVASDGHRPTRPPFLDAAYRAARQRIAERADELFDGTALASLALRGRADLAERS
ncbi:MAG: hypothetical protein M3312_01935 [Actinomycetota bacterium]|nr:hypothetical protein [Actinomycetota bacterium]